MSQCCHCCKEAKSEITADGASNNLAELWALLDFVLPKIFNSMKSFDESYNTPFANSGTWDKIELNEEEALLVIRRLHEMEKADEEAQMIANEKDVKGYIRAKGLSNDALVGSAGKLESHILPKFFAILPMFRLGKNPEDYPDAKFQPHVQVALRLKAKGGSARNGDVIPYVFCVAPGEETVKTAQADRAKHPDEIKRAAGELTVDYEHYLANQVLPPIERLCEPIEGTDRARLAECLGLDPGRYRISGSTPAGSTLTTLDSLVSDAERFRDVAPFLVRCRGCAGQMAFPPIYDRDGQPAPRAVHNHPFTLFQNPSEASVPSAFASASRSARIAASALIITSVQWRLLTCPQ
ncbi:uncharacterized protein F5891DRAFT_1200258 [Suillus fuscotomentosus]|uniref:DNA-directed DNA polymerase n=1 Tax=Suillus fuscotomentosus TaxID=1912939 RepID=A0AAD4HD90_9AGAM|nr:uncharacterized protein F5891DRAFT_1200258 [Suillus fuscotomentosus]KAG1886944.1 hypothetical protein F5891DRAFT_1200258 [Suillus fuscotomentosus]